MHSKQIAKQLAAVLGFDGTAVTARAEGDLIVTSGTGEGGDFAYDAFDVARFLAAHPVSADYSSEFCQEVDALDDVDTARKLGALGYCILRAGSCNPVIAQ